MESFIKWGNEKHKLNHMMLEGIAERNELRGVFGLSEPKTMWQNGSIKKIKPTNFWVFKKSAPQDNQQKSFDGETIVKMLRTGELSNNDMLYPPGSQNWIKIRDAKRLLPFNRVSKGKAGPDTIWWAWPNGKQKKYNSSKEFAQAIAAREVGSNTLVFRNGYDEKLPYSDRDVQDDMHQFIVAEPPSLGNTALMGARTIYLKNGKRIIIKFEDLIDEMKIGRVRNDTLVWVQGYKKDWSPFSEIKKMLPSVGQAPTSNPRGALSSLSKKLMGVIRGKPDADDSYIQNADHADRDFHFNREQVDGAEELVIKSNAKTVHDWLMEQIPKEMADKFKGKEAYLITANMIKKYSAQTKNPDGNGFQEFCSSWKGKSLLQRLMKEIPES